METKYIVAIIFLFVAAFPIVYYAVKGKLDIKLTNTLLLVVIFLALVIAYHDVPKKLAAFGVEFETMENKVESANSNASKAIRIAEEVEKNLENANKIANEAIIQAEKFGAIQAMNTFRIMESDYMDIDREISDWEKSNNIKRDSVAPSSKKDIQDILKKIFQKYNVPKEIQNKYIKRDRLRTMMEDVSEDYLPYAKQFERLDFELPDLPEPIKLPGLRAVYHPNGVKLKYHPKGAVIRSP